MDRTLDEIIGERTKLSNRGRQRYRLRRENAPREGVKKVNSLSSSSSSRIHSRTVMANQGQWPLDGLTACSPSSQSHRPFRTERANLDLDWVHDKFEDDRDTRPSIRGSRAPRLDRYSPEREQFQTGAKIRVTNLHYDLTEDDLEDLFTRIGPISALSLLYDRAGRSEGVAFVTYKRLVDAQTAIREFDGANAKGQPINLTLMSSGSSERPTGRNPFDFAEKPKGSLFDRTEKPRARDIRSVSPEESEELDGTTGRGGRTRRSDVSKPPPEHIDRYIPGQRSPRRRGDGGRSRGSRRPGEFRDSQERNGSPAGGLGRQGENRRPRKTHEELDQEMDDYWKATSAQPNNANGNVTGAVAAEPAPPAMDNDIDMIE
ncbi:hypothetical protein ACO22_07227 [Paracoccidioides brasiliensis]|uniref:RRM domain-containing protein n=1 Tax=Paracoccidioides brasiliensis TaxID=121759 RepID=A0A1D2J5N2_PARBR|nr:hypothetical protein ACO22_07227 [Paracoccidioides brasiliensis]